MEYARVTILYRDVFGNEYIRLRPYKQNKYWRWFRVASAIKIVLLFNFFRPYIISDVPDRYLTGKFSHILLEIYFANLQSRTTVMDKKCIYTLCSLVYNTQIMLIHLEELQLAPNNIDADEHFLY